MLSLTKVIELIIVPMSYFIDAERYRKVKEVSNTELGIVTQCVVLDKPNKTFNKSILGNIVAGISLRVNYYLLIFEQELIPN